MFKNLINTLRQKSLMTQALEQTDGAFLRAEALVRAALGRLLDEKEPEFDVYSADRVINQAQIEVRRMIFQHLAFNPQSDVTAALVLSSVMVDVERIGDYAKNLYEQNERLGRPFQGTAHYGPIRSIAEEILEAFGEAAQAFREGDEKLGERVMREHSGLGRRCEELIDEIVADDQADVRDAVVSALTLRFLKRLSAHLSNIASTVVNPYDRIGFKPGSQPPEDAD